MTAGPLDPRHDPDRDDPRRDQPQGGDPDWGGYRAAGTAEPPLVPGLGGGRTRPMDLSQDPDRFDPSRPPAPPPELPRGLDPAHDPDRFTPPGQGQSLVDLLGKERTHEEHRDGYEWIFGLLMVLAFLGLVAFLFGSVLTP